MLLEIGKVERIIYQLELFPAHRRLDYTENFPIHVHFVKLLFTVLK